MQPHIAVIGAGAFGGWTALHLLRRGARVTLLDAWGPGNSRSSSGGETRVLRGGYGKDALYTQWVARSLELWRESQQQWGVELYRRTGAVWLFAGDDGYLTDSLPHLAALGLRVDPLERAEAARRYPQIRLDDVEKIYLEHEAGFVRARAACQAVCRQFQGDGGRYVQAAVEPGPMASGAMPHAVLADGSRLEADVFVFACGPWLASLFPELVGEAIQATRQEVYFFGTPSGDAGFEPENLPVWLDFGKRRFYGFPSIDGRGLKIADDVRGASIDPSSADRAPTPEGVKAARRFIARRFPRLAGAPLLEARVCQYENSPDGHLILDRHPEAQNVWLAGGGSGHGFKLSPAAGEHVARLVLEGAPNEPRFEIERLAQAGPRTTQFGGSR